MPAQQQTQFIDILFVSALIVFVLMDTIILAFVRIDQTMLPIFASFVSASVLTPLAAWCGFRYGSSIGSKNKDEALTSIAKGQQ
jgi:hypothetical protein